MSDKSVPTPEQRLVQRKQAYVEAQAAGCGPTMIAQHVRWIREAELALVPAEVTKAATVCATHLVEKYADENGFSDDCFGFEDWADDAIEQIAEAISLGEVIDFGDLDGGEYDEAQLLSDAAEDAAEARADRDEGMSYAEGLRGSARFDTW